MYLVEYNLNTSLMKFPDLHLEIKAINSTFQIKYLKKQML